MTWYSVTVSTRIGSLYIEAEGMEQALRRAVEWLNADRPYDREFTENDVLGVSRSSAIILPAE